MANSRCDQDQVPTFNWETYRERNKVEDLVDRLRQWRRITTRYEKRAASYLTMLAVASIYLSAAPTGTAWTYPTALQPGVT